MKTVRFVFTILFLILHCHGNSALIFWFFGGEEESISPTAHHVPSDHPAMQDDGQNVPFEMTTSDEKFQLQAQFIKDLSPLDTCHHKVVWEIQGTCADMHEEDLGKMSVQLLNCQLEAEKRNTYPCTSDMSLADCTQSMDATVWNAYQIVSNRARAICYAARQQQFRMKTEMTVNALVHTTNDQLLAMRKIEETQMELQTATKDTLDRVQSGQERLVAAQSHLQQSQAQISNHMTSNLYALMREKALIATGNKELADMTQAIKAKLDATSDQLSDQEQKQRENHKEILDDLATIRDRAKDVWAKIDESSKEVLRYHTDTKQHYTETLDNLARINSTIANVLATLMDLKGGVEERLSWLMSMVGGTGDRVALLWTLAMHAIYLVIAAISASFLQTPLFSRVLLLVLVPLNAWVEIHGEPGVQQSLGFMPMTALILLTVFGNWSVIWGRYMYSWCRRRSDMNTDLIRSPSCKAITYGPYSPTQPQDLDASTSSAYTACNGSVKPTPEGGHTNHGLNTPDVRKLISVLEKLYQSGALSPQSATSGSANRDGRYSNKGEDTGLGESDLQSPAHLRDYVAGPTPLNPHPTPVPGIEEKVWSCPSPTVELVRRDLLRTMDANPLSPGLGRQAASPRSVSPARNTRYTPPPSDRGSRSSTPSRSSISIGGRPLCLSTTRAGLPCKLASLEGSAFCHKHQVDLN